MNASVVLGLISGVLGLIIGFGAYALGSAGNAMASLAGTNDSFYFYQIMALAAPIACLVGASCVKERPELGSGLIAASALGLFIAFGFSLFTAGPIVLAAVAAVLGFNSAKAS